MTTEKLQELLNSKDEAELFLLNGNLQEYKYHKIYFLREHKKKKKRET